MSAQDEAAPVYVLWLSDEAAPREALAARGIHVASGPRTLDAREIVRHAPDLVVLGVDATARARALAAELSALRPASPPALAVIDAAPSAQIQGRSGIVARIQASLAPAERAREVEAIIARLHVSTTHRSVAAKADTLGDFVARTAGAGRAGVLLCGSPPGAIAFTSDGTCAPAIDTLASKVAGPGQLALRFYERAPGKLRVLGPAPASGATEPAAASLEGLAVMVVDGGDGGWERVAHALEAAGARAQIVAAQKDAIEQARSSDPSLIVVPTTVLPTPVGRLVCEDARLASASLLVIEPERVADLDAASLCDVARQLCETELALRARVARGEPLIERIETLGPARWLKTLTQDRAPTRMRMRSLAGGGELLLVGGKIKDATFTPRDHEAGVARGAAAVRALVATCYGTLLSGPIDDALHERPEVARAASPAIDRRPPAPSPAAAKRAPVKVPRPGAAARAIAEVARPDAAAEARREDAHPAPAATARAVADAPRREDARPAPAAMAGGSFGGDDEETTTVASLDELREHLTRAAQPSDDAAQASATDEATRSSEDATQAADDDAWTSDDAAADDDAWTSSDATPPVEIDVADDALDALDAAAGPEPAAAVPEPPHRAPPALDAGPAPPPPVAARPPTARAEVTSTEGANAPPARRRTTLHWWLAAAAALATIYIAVDRLVLAPARSESDTPVAGSPVGDADPHADTAQTDTAQTDTAQTDTAQTDTAQADTAQADTAQADTAQADTAQADTAQADTAQADTAPADTAQTDTAQTDTAQTDTAQTDGPSATETAPDPVVAEAPPPPDGATAAQLVARSDEAMRAREYGRALELAQQGLALDDRHARAAYVSAISLLRLDRDDEALEWAERAAAWDRGEPLYRLLIGDIHQQNGRRARARAAWRACVEAEPEFAPCMRRLGEGTPEP